MKKLFSSILALTAVSAASAAAPYVGASVGYLIDSEEAYVATRLGFDLGQSHGVTHSLEGEVGFSTDSADGVSLDLIPVMLNYRATAQYTPKVELFSGIGAGFTALSLDVDTFGYNFDENDTTFSAQAFVGANFKIATHVSLTLAARYLWINDAEFSGYEFEVGDDVAIEAGIRITF